MVVGIASRAGSKGSAFSSPLRTAIRTPACNGRAALTSAVNTSPLSGSIHCASSIASRTRTPERVSASINDRIEKISVSRSGRPSGCPWRSLEMLSPCACGSYESSSRPMVVEQLDKRTVGQILLPLAGPRCQHPPAGSRRIRQRRTPQRGLADARWPLHDCHPWCVVARRLRQVASSAARPIRSWLLGVTPPPDHIEPQCRGLIEGFPHCDGPLRRPGLCRTGTALHHLEGTTR